MTLEMLQKEMIVAMKSGDKERKAVLTSAIGAIKNAAIAKKCKDNISEDLVAEVLLKEQKTIQEQIATCPEDRVELKAKFEYDLAVISEFAPRIITDPEEVKAMIIAACDEQGMEIAKQNRGFIMKAMKGKADMKVVNTVVGGMM